MEGEKKKIKRRIEGIGLGKHERRLVEYLIEEVGKVKRVEEIIREVYEEEADKSNRIAIKTMINRTNKKIERTGIKIKNKREIGYYIEEVEKKRRRGEIKNHYKDIKQISEEKLIEIIRNLRK